MHSYTVQEAMRMTKQGKKMTHPSFSREEWVSCECGHAQTEEGYLHNMSDFWNDPGMPEDLRRINLMPDGWTIWEEPTAPKVNIGDIVTVDIETQGLKPYTADSEDNPIGIIMQEAPEIAMDEIKIAVVGGFPHKDLIAERVMSAVHRHTAVEIVDYKPPSEVPKNVWIDEASGSEDILDAMNMMMLQLKSSTGLRRPNQVVVSPYVGFILKYDLRVKRCTAAGRRHGRLRKSFRSRPGKVKRFKKLKKLLQSVPY